MPFYESVFIARQDISSAQVDHLVETFSQLITEQGGSIPKTEYWGLRNLAYRIKKNRKGHYVLMNIDASPAAMQEMERQIRLNEDVIRLLTVRVDELEEGPSAIMQNRGRDRGGRGGPRGRGPDSDRGPPDRGGSERAAASKPAATAAEPAAATPPAEADKPAEGDS